MNTTPHKTNSDEITQHMSKPLQLMLEIEDRAQAKVAEILQSIERGETTLAEVISQRRISNIQNSEPSPESRRLSP